MVIAALNGRLYEELNQDIVERYEGDEVAVESTITVTGPGVLEYDGLLVTLSRSGTYRVDDLLQQTRANSLAELGQWQSVAVLADRIAGYLSSPSDDDSLLSQSSPAIAERYRQAAVAALAGRHEDAYRILAVGPPDYDEPLYADYLLLHATVSIALFDHSEALATLRDLIADSSLTAEQEQQLRLLQGLAYYGLGNYGSARQYFRLVVSLNPISSPAVRAQALLDEIVSGSRAQ